MQNRLIKVDRIQVEDSQLILKRAFRSWRLNPDEITQIRLQPVSSLVDEIGVFLESKRKFFLTDAMRGFQEIVELLDFNNLFGSDWYKRADGGELLTWIQNEEKKEVAQDKAKRHSGPPRV